MRSWSKENDGQLPVVRSGVRYPETAPSLTHPACLGRAPGLISEARYRLKLRKASGCLPRERTIASLIGGGFLLYPIPHRG